MDNQLIKEILQILPQDIGLIKITQYQFSNQVNDLQKICSLQSTSRISINNLTLIEEIQQKLSQFHLPIKMQTELVESLFPLYVQDEIVYGFANLHQYEDGLFKKNQKFDTLLDFINIIVFWTSENYDSLQTYKDIQTRLNTSQMDIKIFGINIDSSYESWEKCMIELQTYDSYHLSKSNKNYDLLMKALQINVLPYFLFINKSQKLILNGVYDFQSITFLIQSLCQDAIHQQDILNKEVELVKNEDILVSKEEFQVMKNLMKQDIQEMIQAIFSEEDKINLQLIKKTMFIDQKQKKVIYRSKLFIEKQISENSEESYNAFLQYLDEVIPNKQFLNYKTKKIQKISEEEQVAKFFTQEILSQYDLESILYQQESLNFKWSYEQNSFICNHKVKDSYKLNKKIDLKQFDRIYQQIQGIIDNMEGQFQENVRNHFNQLLQPIGLGDNFEKIDGFYNRLGEETIIEHKPGQILVIVWLVPCAFIIIKLEQTRQKLIETFGDKLNIVFLAIRKSEEDIAAIYKHQPESQFYYPKIDPDIAMQKYNVDVFPFLTIVDMIGVVRHGDLFQKFHDKINWVYSYCIQKQYHQQTDINQEGLSNYLLHQNTITKSLGDSLKIEFNITIKQNQKQEFIAVTEYMTRQKLLQHCHKMLSNIGYYIEREKNTVIQNVIKAFSIPFPIQHCNQCRSNVGRENPFYFNFFQFTSLCCKCAEEQKNGKYVITDILAFINAPISNPQKLTDIDVYRFGKNIKPIGNESQVHDATCDGCGQQKFLGDRYIVINGQKGKLMEGGFQDYCQSCFALIRNRTYKQQQSKNFKGIDENTVFLRVLYHFGYYNF